MSICGLHEHDGAVCRPCAVLKAAIARELAETTPWHVIQRERAALRAAAKTAALADHLTRPA